MSGSKLISPTMVFTAPRHLGFYEEGMLVLILLNWTFVRWGGWLEVKKNVSKERSRNTPLLLFNLTKLLKCEFTPFHFQTFNFTQLTLFIFYFFNLLEQLITSLSLLVPQHFPDWFLWHPGVPTPTFWEGTKFLDKIFFLNYLIH